MFGLVIQWLATAVALLVAAYILPGIKIKDFKIALLAAAVLGIVNALIRPIVAFLTLPLTWITFGLFAIVVNGLMLWLAAKLVPDFEINGCITSVLGALLVSIVSTVIMIPFS